MQFSTFMLTNERVILTNRGVAYFGAGRGLTPSSLRRRSRAVRPQPHAACARGRITTMAKNELSTTRKLSRRQFMQLSGGAAAYAALLACQPSSPVSGSPTPGGATSAPTAKVGGQAIISLGEPDTLGPTSRALVGAYIFSFIANGLVRLKYPDMTVVPDLADSFSPSSDGKTYTFNLHKGVKWHNGQAFSADDVKFTFEFMAHPNNPAPLSIDLANIVGAKDFKEKKATEITGVKASADKIEISLIAPSPNFLTSLAVTKILPKAVLANVSPADIAKDPFARKPIYTGPFKVDEWKSGESVTYSAFTDHFRGRPNLDKIVQRIFPDPSTALAELRSGGIQQAFVTADQFADFQSNPQYQTQQLAGTTGWFLSWDMTNKTFPFGEKPFRQAVSMAIDRKTLVATVFKGLADENYSLASPLSWVYNANAPKNPFDQAKAKQLLDDLGWKVGSGGIREKGGVRLEYATMVTTTTRDWFLAIQPMLQAVGIGTTKVDVVDFPTWISRLNVGKYESTVNGWGNFAIDPRSDLAAHFRSPRTSGDATGYKNDQVDALFAQAATAVSQEEQKRIYDQIQMLAEGDAVYAYLIRPKVLEVNVKALSLPQAKIQAEIYDGMPQWGLS
ncbi:MAG: ABC transporter substrate-binding protein [Chloroflexi bacterium]|nr:MAG: ABC transporter substrate-binding protein [Chloroflexota bacterium]